MHKPLSEVGKIFHQNLIELTEDEFVAKFHDKDGPDLNDTKLRLIHCCPEPDYSAWAFDTICRLSDGDVSIADQDHSQAIEWIAEIEDYANHLNEAGVVL